MLPKVKKARDLMLKLVFLRQVAREPYPCDEDILLAHQISISLGQDDFESVGKTWSFLNEQEQCNMPLVFLPDFNEYRVFRSQEELEIWTRQRRANERN